eukprot:TRINITY_DN12654_c0_g1_i1.p1 TRINITY_DN12654_c0_g1~~TRINITY_DN12654_c0_g1_i1.p1  ORF type:complete len:479 (-),score=119.68 TRINITY_DN12654_c0_g1_i1:41-1477(-)
MQFSWVFVCTVCTICGVCQVVGQRRQFLQDVIQRIKSSPKHQSSSPSWFGERQFEVIGTGRLPLQNHHSNAESDVIERDIEEDNFDEFYTNSDRRDGGEAISHETVNRYEVIAVNDAHQPSKNQALQYFENAQKTSLHPGQQHTNTRQGYQGLGQLSQDREYAQGFKPSNLDFGYHPQESDRRQSQHPGINNNHYFDQRDQQKESYEHPSTFLADSDEIFQENFKRFRRKPETNTYFGKYGLEWEQRRSRKKRSPFKRIKIKVDNPFYFSNPSHPKRQPTQGPSPRRQQAQVLKTTRYASGPQGFWDDADFDTNFFDRGHFESSDAFRDANQPASSQYPGKDDQRFKKGYITKENTEYDPGYTDENYHEYHEGYRAEDDRGHRREQYRQQSVSVQKPHRGGGQFANVRNYLEKEEENDILGSGNFYIETGGTFYDDDDDPYAYSNPQSYSNYGNNNFNNFRDFADIKGDRLAGRRYQY